MSRPRFMPDADPAFLVWFENFASKFALVAATLGLSGELAVVQADLGYTRFVINNTEGQRQRLSDNVSVKNQLLNGPIGLSALAYPGPAALTGLIPPAPGTLPPSMPAGVIPRLSATI